jgi:hypothetical protein
VQTAVAQPAAPPKPPAVVVEPAPFPPSIELAPAAVVNSVVESVVAPSSERLDAAPAPAPARAPPAAVGEDEFRRLFEQIRDAVDARAAEVEKGRRQRSFFSGLLFLVMAAMALGFWTLVAGFDRGVFANALKDGLVDRAPALFDSARTVAKEIVPVYEAEIERTMPDFSRALADAFAREASVLGERLSPVLARAAGDKAVVELAAALKAAFPEDVKDDATARKLALAIRAAQARAKVDGPDAPEASYVLVGQIQDALQTLGPPEQGALAEGRIADGIRDAALDVLKAKLSSGEGLGIDAMIRQRLGTEPAPADLDPAPVPVPAKGGK